MKPRRHPHAHRPTFKQICEHGRSEAHDALASKARTANRIAKIAGSRQSRDQAYRAKDAALNQGIALGIFQPRSDENGNQALLRVRDRRGRELHLPRRKLTATSQSTPQIQALLGIRQSNAA